MFDLLCCFMCVLCNFIFRTGFHALPLLLSSRQVQASGRGSWIARCLGFRRRDYSNPRIHIVFAPSGTSVRVNLNQSLTSMYQPARPSECSKKCSKSKQEEAPELALDGRKEVSIRNVTFIISTLRPNETFIGWLPQ